MAQRDAYSRKQLRSPEGFREVIIGTGGGPFGPIPNHTCSDRRCGEWIMLADGDATIPIVLGFSRRAERDPPEAALVASASSSSDDAEIADLGRHAELIVFHRVEAFRPELVVDVDAAELDVLRFVLGGLDPIAHEAGVRVL